MKDLSSLEIDREPSLAFAAIILCGGRSKRMGTDKAWLAFEKETFLQTICRSLTDHAAPIIAVAYEDQQLPELPDRVTIVRDLFPDEGPLGGFLTGLGELHRAATDHDTPLWLCSCDAPFCNIDVIQLLISRLGNSDAVAVQAGGRAHPLSAVYSRAVQLTVRELFNAGERRLSAVLEQLNTTTVHADELRTLDPELSFLCSINTPEEFKKAKSLHASRSAG